MTSKIALIIDGDEASAKLLGAVCERLGVQVAGAARNGKEGLEKACALSPDLVLLDLLLPGLDGFKVAESGRAALLAGKRRCHPESALGPALAPPPGIQEVCLAGASPRPARGMGRGQAGPGAGDLAGSPRAAGRCAQRPRRRAFPRRDGRGVRCATVPSPRCSSSARPSPRRPLLLSSTAGFRSRRSACLARGRPASLSSSATARHRPRIAATAPGRPWCPCRRRSPPPRRKGSQAAPGRGARAGHRSAPKDALSPGQSREAHFLDLPFESPEQAVLGEVALKQEDPTDARPLGAPSLESAEERLLWKEAFGDLHPPDVLRLQVRLREAVQEDPLAGRREDLPLLVAFLELGLATAPGVSREAPARPAPALARPFTPEEEAARILIEAEHCRVMNAANLFAVLGLKRDASDERLRAACLALARKFRADSFSGLALGAAQGKLGESFARVAEANATLVDPRRRADYDVLLERQEAGLPTDVGVILQAEAAHARGDALMKQGRFLEAEAAIKEALKLDGSVAQYHAALGQVLLRGRGRSGLAEARVSFDKALALNPDFPPVKLGRASVLQLEGKLKAAESLFREILLGQPGNTEASRQLRALRGLSKRVESKGFLGKLFER